MSEAIKGVILPRGTVEINGKMRHVYAVAMVVVGDEQATGTECFFMCADDYNPFADLLHGMGKAKPAFKQTDLCEYLLTIANMKPEEFKQLEVTT